MQTQGGAASPGNPAVISSVYVDLDQWLCVPPFRVVCHYQAVRNFTCFLNVIDIRFQILGITAPFAQETLITYMITHLANSIAKIMPELQIDHSRYVNTASSFQLN